ncbi:type VII secretion system-associated protein [Streptomyces sp. NPDC057717]|uniref:type VII secretion system-associated protein n=1 Tax=Streptomyces sp. NPDC057717 TaxID=3346224 RepID=UPI0036CE2AE0
MRKCKKVASKAIEGMTAKYYDPDTSTLHAPDALGSESEAMSEPPHDIREAARLAVDHWFSKTDPAGRGNALAPNSTVVGAWRSDSDGEIVDWLANESHQPSPEAPSSLDDSDPVDAAVQLAATDYGPAEEATFPMAELTVLTDAQGRPVSAASPDVTSAITRSTSDRLPDGTTHAPGAAAAVAPPITPPAGDPVERLAAAQAAGRAHDFARAIPVADEALQQFATEFGDTARETLEVAEFRADLAYLSGDFVLATASWTCLASAWFDRLGPGKRRTQLAAGNAAAAWMQLPPHDAVATATDLLSMLLDVTAPERTKTIRSRIRARLLEIAK